MFKLLGSCLFLFASALLAQTPDTATIQGQVTDPSRAAVPGVRVAARNQQTGLERTALTDGAGNYSLAGLPVAGSYQIAATRQGFADAQVKDVTRAGGAPAGIDLQLSVSGGQTQVTVTGTVGEVRTDAPQIGTRLGERQIEETPLLRRRITNLPLFNAANPPPLSQGGGFLNQTPFPTNGAGRRQALFVTDGATNNDSWGRQTLFSTLPVSAVAEMSVLANAFSAEYGATVGGVINIVTKSGGSAFHGDVLELWRPADTAATLSGFTAANATSGNQLTSDSLGQSAVSLGGPFSTSLSSKTHFFAAGEFSREDKGSPVTSPVAPGIFIGHYRGWLGLLRLDRQIDGRNNLFFRGNVDGFHDTNPNGIVGGNSLPTVARVFRRRTYSEELGETAVLSPNLLNNVRVHFQIASPITQFDPVVYGTQFQVPIAGVGTFTTGTSQAALLINRQYQINDTLSTTKGRHQLRFGTDVLLLNNVGVQFQIASPITQFDPVVYGTQFQVPIAGVGTWNCVP